MKIIPLVGQRWLSTADLDPHRANRIHDRPIDRINCGLADFFCPYKEAGATTVLPVIVMVISGWGIAVFDIGRSVWSRFHDRNLLGCEQDGASSDGKVNKKVTASNLPAAGDIWFWQRMPEEPHVSLAFAAMIVVSTAIMFGLMYLNSYATGPAIEAAA
jgi:hypothetical protein